MVAKLTAADLFAGAGGFTMGAERAGLRVTWAVNHWPEALQTHAKNHSGVEHRQHNLFDVSPKWFSEMPPVDVLLASPSCQGFSLARRSGDDAAKQELRATAFTVLTAISGMSLRRRLPRLVLVENVTQFRNWGFDPDKADGSQFQQWKNYIMGFGYEAQEIVIDAADVGVPQNRTRLFVMFTRKKVEIPEPASEHVGFKCCVDLRSGEWTPVGKHPTKFRREKMRVARENHPDDEAFLVLMDTKNKGRSLERPIGTITTESYGQWYVVKRTRSGDVYRPLGVTEFKRAMDFPASYALPKAATTAVALLGNAVVPSVAEYLIRHAVESAA